MVLTSLITSRTRSVGFGGRRNTSEQEEKPLEHGYEPKLISPLMWRRSRGQTGYSHSGMLHCYTIHA